MTASSSSSFSSKENYDVFLSFRGEHIRRRFIGYLYLALCQKSIHTYMDDQTLESGHEISPMLTKAIQESNIYIIILSENFASSTWCLDELVQILECKKNEDGKIVIPIFYDIKPSIVRKQLGRYAEAFGEHEQRFRDKMEKVQQWRNALVQVANLSGYDSKNFRYECDLVEHVVGDILSRLSKYQLTNYGNLIGIEEPVKEINSLLSIGEMDARIIGIWGMGGIGKTTLARIVFQRLCSHFDDYCFLEDIREEADDINHLRHKLLSKLLQTNTLDVGSKCIQDRLRHKKVLIILDNLNGRTSNLQDLFEGYQFANGSRIIVTSRDKQLLRTMAHAIYELKGLDHHDALQLFCFHAFGRNSLATGYEALIESVTHYARGNPLALKVLGSSLKSKGIKEWESALEQLKTDGDPHILKTLKLSFDGLGNKRIQDVFLDMECFFDGGMVREDVESISNRPEHSDAAIRIRNRTDKSLLTEEKEYSMGAEKKVPIEINLKMPDLLRQMGQQIVCGENKDPGNRSRVWNAQDVTHIFEKNTGTSKIEGISLNLHHLKRDVKVLPTTFSNMPNLRLLKIKHSDGRYCRNSIKLPDGLKPFVSEELSYFHWDSYPLNNLPYFNPENLVELNMRGSQLCELPWNEEEPVEFRKLKKMDLSFSEHLTKIPNLSWATNLQDIRLGHCTSLVHIPPFFSESQQPSVSRHDKLLQSERRLGKSSKQPKAFNNGWDSN